VHILPILLTDVQLSQKCIVDALRKKTETRTKEFSAGNNHDSAMLASMSTYALKKTKLAERLLGDYC
jgi:hypothetical protein